MSVAVVTGGAGGIGAACVRALAAAGHDVAVLDPAPARVAEAALQLAVDATAPQELAAALERVRAELGGPIGIAVGGVSHEQHGSALAITPEQLDASLRGTAHAALALAQPVARQMIDAGQGGRIVFVGSLHATLAFPAAAAYNAAEAALLAVARSLARDLLTHRIAVNVVEPGWIDTPGERRWYSEEQLAAAATRMPWGRLGRPDDVAAAVAFLASSQAEYITGTTLRVDGGMSLAMTDLPGADA
jgi:glucose 1-dehydrogenase